MRLRVESLIQYLGSLLTETDRESFAQKCGTSLGYMNLIMYGHRKCSATLAIAIDRESNGAVRCDDLCPDADFAYLRNNALTE